MKTKSNINQIIKEVETLKKLTYMDPFSEKIVKFVAHFSDKLLDSQVSKKYPELTVLGFWLRKSNIIKLKKEFKNRHASRILIPRGIIFQIPPSNVNSVFVYSWILSLLAGNKNLIRISTNQSDQMKFILEVLKKIFEDKYWFEIYERNKFFYYNYEEDINSYLSICCDSRVIWGGDKTVQKMKEFEIRPHVEDINFPDKISICIIDLEEYAKLDQNKKLVIVENFMNDSYWFDQLACSSPRAIFWLSKEKIKNKIIDEFWQNLSNLLRENKIKLSNIDSINKLVTTDRIALEYNGMKVSKSDNPLISRIDCKEAILRSELMPGGGFFYEFSISNLHEISSLIERKLQTITYFGIKKKDLEDFILINKPEGIDRIVPVGKALNFDVVWDGVDLLYSFSREVVIQ